MTRTANGFTDAVVPLLKEFTEKLMRLDDRIGVVMEKYLSRTTPPKAVEKEPLAIKHFYQRLLPGVKKLAQTVSQRLEHAQLEDLERLELNLRLSELEAALILVQERIQNMPG